MMTMASGVGPAAEIVGLINSELDGRQWDVLPDYETPPDYAPEEFHQPFLTYHLRTAKTNMSHLVPFEPAVSNTQPSYAIRYRSSIALPFFKCNSDISVSRVWPSSMGKEAEVAARADFHDKGPLPYCPRARFTIGGTEGGRDDTVEMECRNWKNWTFCHEARPYVWTLRDVPACIELSVADAFHADQVPVIARFMYGKVGTKVLAGGEVGRLTMWRDALTGSVEGREVVVTGCLVVVRYFEGLGRRYRNDGSGGSVTAGLVNAKGKERTTVRAKLLLF